MSAEKLPFVIPAVCTIGPRVDDHESLLKYAKLISPHDKLSNHIKELVQRIIQGEIRVLASSMTMEKVFRGTKVFEKVQLELNQFGLLIYNAMVDVAEAKIKGEVGSKSREGQTLQNAAKIDAETKEGIRVRRTEVKAEASSELAKKTN